MRANPLRVFSFSDGADTVELPSSVNKLETVSNLAKAPF